MAPRLIDDELWQRIEPHLAPPKRVGGRGRPPVGDRQILAAILFVLKTGISWDALPEEMGCGCGMTVLRRLRTWQQNGTWRKIRPILEKLPGYRRGIDWDRADRFDCTSTRGCHGTATSPPPPGTGGTCNRPGNCPRC